MARCGCNTAMSTTCDAIMSCIVANLGRGLDYNEATRQLELRISTDQGNIAAIGTDDGFYSPASTGPGDMVWPKTVTTLPEQAISASSASNLVGPALSPEMVEYSIANGIDMYAVPVYAVADWTVHESVGGPTVAVTAYTDNPGGMQNQYMSSLTMQHLHYDTGTRVNPTGRNSGAPSALQTPDGGWGGFYAPEYKPRTVSEMLRQVRGRMVVSLNVVRQELPVPDLTHGVQATIRDVVEAGAQEWVLITVPAQLTDDSRAPLDEWIGMILDAGITAGVNLFNENTMPDPFTAAEIVSTGATWAHVNSPGRPTNPSTDTRITELVTAGLEVIVSTSARQYWTTHAFGLGARAVQAADAVYARGSRGEPGDLNYRQTMVPGLETRTTAIGALTPRTDSNTAMWHPGFARSDLPGRWFPERYGWNGSVELYEINQLLGTICPIPNVTDYQIRLRVRRDPAAVMSSSQEVGIFFAMPDDRDIASPSGDLNPLKRGYMARITTEASTSGFRQLSIRRFDGGGFSTLASEVNTVALPTDSWADLTVRVEGDQLTFIATVAGTTRTLSATDTTWRGAYAAYAWRDAIGSTPGFVHGYTNPTDLVMYEALS